MNELDTDQANWQVKTSHRFVEKFYRLHAGVSTALHFQCFSCLFCFPNQGSRKAERPESTDNLQDQTGPHKLAQEREQLP